MADASEREVASAIRSAGLGNQKAGRIRTFLLWLREERGALSLEFLHEESNEFAVEMLTHHNGIGVKTAYVTLMLASSRDLFAIDVHIHRIATRLGLIGEKVNPEKAHGELGPCVPEGRAHELHVNLLAFGRTICTARNPVCAECGFTRMCVYYRTPPGRKRTRRLSETGGRPYQKTGRKEKLTNLISAIGAGELLAILSSITFSIAQIFIRQGMRSATPLTAALIINSIVSLGGLSISIYRGTLFTSGLAPILWFVAVGFAGPGIGRIAAYIGITRMGLSRSVTISSSTPLWSTLIAITILGESPSGWTIFGTFGIVFGVALVSMREDDSQTFRSWLTGALVFPLIASVAYALPPTFSKMAYVYQQTPAVGMAIAFLTAQLSPPHSKAFCSHHGKDFRRTKGCSPDLRGGAARHREFAFPMDSNHDQYSFHNTAPEPHRSYSRAPSQLYLSGKAGADHAPDDHRHVFRRPRWGPSHRIPVKKKAPEGTL